jgi:1,4-alpha-glucan branching enzyme
MLDKMSGPRDKRFDSFRTFLAYMAAHPGKKLMFMGQEFAQYKEWNYENELDWDILKFEEHKKMHEFVREINTFYLESSELWENESDWSGFKWLVADDNHNSVIIFRRINTKGDELIIVCNFKPNYHENYTFGVPFEGDYKEVFSSDRLDFGGSGVENKKLTAFVPNEKLHGENFALTVKIAPMSAFFLKPLKNAKNTSDKAEE